MLTAVALTDEAGLQPFTTPSGWMGSIGPPPQQAYTREELAESLERTEPTLHELLDAVADRAPSLCNREALLPLARLAAWTDSDEWVRPLDEWPGEQQSADEDAKDEDEEDAEETKAAALVRSLAAHLLEKWDVPETLHGALAFADGPPPTEAAHRISRAFMRVHAAVGKGEASVLTKLREEVSPSISKAAAKHFVKLDELAAATAEEAGGTKEEEEGEAAGPMTLMNPLHALRRAQSDLSAEGSLVGTSLINFFLEMRSIDPSYTPVGRTPKTVSAALEAYVATTIDFGKDCPDEAFQPNPRGLKPLFEMDATIPTGTKVRIPYYWSANEVGESNLGGEFAGGAPAVVRIAEIRSLQRLFYEGEMLDNCLQGSRSSQAKYLSRARNRVSSFWSLTKQAKGSDTVEHMCLIEVWHLGRGVNEIRQAEGPRPRTLPSPEAWYWLDVWCKREGVDLSTWDCYS